MIEERPLSPRGIQILAAAIIIAVAVYAAAGTLYVLVMDHEPPAELGAPDKKIIDIGLLLFAVLCAGASFLVRRQINRSLPGNAAGNFAAKFRAVVVGMAIAEAGSVAALVYALVLQDLSVAYIAWGISLAAAILHFPPRAWITEPGPQAQGSE